MIPTSIAALEVWSGPAEWRGWVLVQTGTTFEILHATAPEAEATRVFSPVLAAVAKAGAAFAAALPVGLPPGWRTVQTLTVEPAARKLMGRMIREAVGGKPGWAPTYQGPFTLDGLADRPKDRFSDDPEVITVAATEAVPVFADDFQARRRAALQARAKAGARTAEAARAEDAGKRLVRAYHPADAPKLAGVEVVGLMEERTEPVAQGKVIRNNDSYATIEVGEIPAGIVAWYLSSPDRDVLIGVSGKQ